MISKKVYFYFNGEKDQGFLSTTTYHPIKYIGNNREGNEPFGVFCDFRIYLFLISDEKIKLLANQESSTAFFLRKDDFII